MGRGRKQKNRKRTQQQHQQSEHKTHPAPNKRRKTNKKRASRCWIEDCPETDPNEYEKNPVDVELNISRVMLFDNHSSSRVDVPLPSVNSQIEKSNINDDRKGDDDHRNTSHTLKPDEVSTVDKPVTSQVKKLSSTGMETTSKTIEPVSETNVAINKSPMTITTFGKNGEHIENSRASVVAPPTTMKAPFEEPFRHEPAPVTTAAHSTDNSNDDDKLESNKASTDPHVVEDSPVIMSKTVYQGTSEEKLSGTTVNDTVTTATGSEHNLPKNARIAVRRHPSAKGPVIFPKAGFVHLPNGDCGDGIVNPYPDTVDDKYWAQRHRLFSRFERGIQLDHEGWFSVTPEAIANHVAQKMTADTTVDTTTDSTTSTTTTSTNDGMIVLDAFVGVGGNAIAFAKRQRVGMVICVDTDKKRLDLAANNCRVYGIPANRVMFVRADATTVLRLYQRGKRISQDSSETTRKERDTEHVNQGVVEKHGYKFVDIDELPDTLDAIFLSPPWGGSEYSNQRHFDLESIQVNETVNGDDLLQLAIQALPPDKLNVAYFLPRNTNGWRIGQCAHRVGLRTVEMEQNYLNHKLKTITLYVRT